MHLLDARPESSLAGRLRHEEDETRARGAGCDQHRTRSGAGRSAVHGKLGSGKKRAKCRSCTLVSVCTRGRRFDEQQVPERLLGRSARHSRSSPTQGNAARILNTFHRLRRSVFESDQNRPSGDVCAQRIECTTAKIRTQDFRCGFESRGWERGIGLRG